MTQNETTGGEALARMLMAFKAGPMFGMGGFQLLPFYDAARRLGLRHNLINDERCAVFAADAYEVWVRSVVQSVHNETQLHTMRFAMWLQARSHLLR